MDSRHAALRLFLEELGLSLKIDTVADRKILQKAVFLGQAAGVNLGYQFGWYLMGPYSPSLTKDYYALAGTTVADQAEPLPAAAKQTLAQLKLLLEPRVNMPQEDWLELLASHKFLRTVRGYDLAKTRQVMTEQKAHLLEFVDLAESTLEGGGLLSSRMS